LIEYQLITFRQRTFTLKNGSKQMKTLMGTAVCSILSRMIW